MRVISRCALRESEVQLYSIEAGLTTFTRPSLMGTHTGSQIADASYQAKVLDTILMNATAIFDED